MTVSIFWPLSWCLFQFFFYVFKARLQTYNSYTACKNDNQFLFTAVHKWVLGSKHAVMPRGLGSWKGRILIKINYFYYRTNADFFQIKVTLQSWKLPGKNVNFIHLIFHRIIFLIILHINFEPIQSTKNVTEQYVIWASRC